MTGVGNLASTIIPSLDRPARSGSLYVLRYRGPLHAEIENLKGFITSILITITVVVVVVVVVVGGGGGGVGGVVVVDLYLVQHIMLLPSKSVLITHLS